MEKVLESKHNILTKLFVVLMLIGAFFCGPTVAQAATIAHIQASVDVNSWEVLAAVVRDNIGVTAHSPEVRRVDSAVLSSLASGSFDLSASKTALAGLSSYVSQYGSDNYDGIKVNGNAIGGLLGAGEKNRVLTFPSEGKKSDTADYNRAFEVNDALIYDLNQAFSLWLDAKGYVKTPNLQDFYNRMQEFLNSVSVSGDNCTIAGLDGSLQFRWRIEKYTDGSDSVHYVNWGMLVYEGFNNYLLEGEEAVTDQTVYTANPGQLEKVLVNMFQGTIDGLRSLLGLWSIDELMFNTGGREKGYVGGIFPSGWEPVIWTLFIVAEVLAALVVMYGIISRILQRSVSTINTFARLRAMQQVQDIIVCTIVLALLPLALRVIISMSQNFTDMIYALVPDDPSEPNGKMKIIDMVSRYSNGGSTLSSCIAQCMFFGVQVYFNFFYMLRSLMVAFLIIIAPIMISMIMVSDSKKQMAVVWSKELFANVLIQPIHAFIMTTILLLPNSSHGFDNLIALYALIPLTTAMRSMFFGHAGGFMDRAAEAAKGKVTGTVSKGIVAGGLAGVALAGNKIGQAFESRKAGEGKGSDSGSGSNLGADSNNLGREGATAPAGTAPSGGEVAGNSGEARAAGSNAGDSTLPVTNNASGHSKALGVLKGAAIGAGAVGLAAVGGALSGAGFSGGHGITSMGMRIASYRPRGASGVANGASANNGNSGQRSQEGNAPNTNNTRPDLSNIEDVPNSVELGASNSGFANMGEVAMGKNGDTIAQRYYADNDALNNMGINNVQDTGQEISFNADPSKSPEAAELGHYADYCQYLEANGMSAERAQLQHASGISATRTGDGSVAVTMNKGNWRAARNDGNKGYQEGAANIRTKKEYQSDAVKGMYIEGPKGATQSLVGGMQAPPGNGGGTAGGGTGGNAPHPVSFKEVMKAPERYSPSQYTASTAPVQTVTGGNPTPAPTPRNSNPVPNHAPNHVPTPSSGSDNLGPEMPDLNNHSPMPNVEPNIEHTVSGGQVGGNYVPNLQEDLNVSPDFPDDFEDDPFGQSF